MKLTLEGPSSPRWVLSLGGFFHLFPFFYFSSYFFETGCQHCSGYLQIQGNPPAPASEVLRLQALNYHALLQVGSGFRFCFVQWILENVSAMPLNSQM